MFWPSLSWLLLLANFMSLAELTLLGRATLSVAVGLTPGFLSAPIAYSAPRVLFHFQPAPIAVEPGYMFWKLYDRFLAAVKLARLIGALVPPRYVSFSSLL